MELFLNRVWATLASGITDVATTLPLTAGHGARFGTIAAGNKVRIVFLDTSGNVTEIAYITAISGDNATITRGQDGTSGVAHIVGDRVECRIGKSTMESMVQVAMIHEATSKTTPVDTDEFPIADSEASFGLKRLTWANTKATLKTYFDGLYAALAGSATQDFATADLTVSGLQTLAAGANIASAATVDLTAATGNTVIITGIEAISAFIMNAGQQMFVIANGALPLTYNATTMNINGGASYTCAAGDRVIAFKDGGGVIRVNVIKQDGTALVASQGSGRLINTNIYTSDSTYSKGTNNPSYIVVEMVGGGGGGGGVAAAAAAAGGGGGGGFARKKILNASLGASETVTVGTAGTAGTSGGGTGGNGGTSSLGALCSAQGGYGGTGATTGGASGGNGGIGSGGDLNLGGAGGTSGAAQTNVSGGAGGSSFFGGGAPGAAGGTSAGAAGATNTGGGGGGAIGGTANAGGAGGTGLVIVYEYS